MIPRKESNVVKTPTKKKRAKIARDTRQLVAGPSKGSAEAQHVSELKLLPMQTRREVTSKAGIREKTSMAPEAALAMKETVGLTWSQMRAQRPFLKAHGLTLPNETKKRAYGKQLVSKFVKVESKDFTIDRQIQLRPYASIHTIRSYLSNLLDTYEQNKQLTWHSGTIPDDEIWVKIGADHGKGSFKVCMAVANLEKPNSKSNTHLIGMAYVKDTHENLQIFMKDINTKITHLQNMRWNGKQIVIFLRGDYDFLCKVYGLSGPQGTYPCLWCLTSKKEIQQQTDKPLRTLELLKSDYENFKTRADEDKRQAQQYNNCIHEPLVNIQLDKVSPPYLHILLGIVLKHHRLLEQVADSIDRDIYIDTHSDRSINSRLLSDYGKNWNIYTQKTEEIALLEGFIAFGGTQPPEETETWEESLERVQEELEKVTFAPLEPLSGPVCSQLDAVLDKHAITPQAYFSRSFTGNHCNTYLQPNVFPEITASVVKTTLKWTRNPVIRDKAREAKLRFDSLNKSYALVHKDVSHTNPIPPGSLTEIKTNIDAYMAVYRQHFKNKIIPKQHILESHCLPFIQKHKMGLGLLGEQGGELIHGTIATLEKRMACIRKVERKMKTLMECHLLQVAPCLHRFVPKTKRRKTVQQ